LLLKNLTFTSVLDYYLTTTKLKLLDMADLDGSQNVRIVMRLTAGVQYGIGSEIVLYTPGA
jgi:hypothetical protein